MQYIVQLAELTYSWNKEFYFNIVGDNKVVQSLEINYT